MSDEDFNPYEAPKSDLATDRDDADMQLAGRFRRLAAVLLDTLFRLLLIVPVFWFSGYFTRAMAGKTSALEEVVWTFAALLLFLGSQVYPLHRWGQTWGKRILGIRIANLDGSKPDLWSLLGIRYGLFEFSVQLPFLGPLLNVVDSLMIFRGDRRCLHDLVAGTRVVKVSPVPPAMT